MNEIESLLNDFDNNSFYDWNYNYLFSNKKRYQYEFGKILEIGSAPCHLTYLLKRKKYPVVGLDINPERFKDFIKKKDLHVVKCNIETEPLPFDDNEFGLILFNETFEHLRFNPIATLQEINRVLKPKGKLILSTPNLYSIRNVVNFLLGKGFDDPYKEFMKLYNIGHMGHVRVYSAKQVNTFLENTGFDCKKVLFKSYNKLKGLWFPFNFVRMIFPWFNTYQIHICRNTDKNNKE